MPVHDWLKVDAGLFHNFHQGWTVALCNRLNGGVLPGDYFALVEQKIKGPIVRKCEAETYANKANTITVRHRHGEVVALIEVISPGNKASRGDFREIIEIIEKTARLLREGVHQSK